MRSRVARGMSHGSRDTRVRADATPARAWPAAGHDYADAVWRRRSAAPAGFPATADQAGHPADPTNTTAPLSHPARHADRGRVPGPRTLRHTWRDAPPGRLVPHLASSSR